MKLIECSVGDKVWMDCDTSMGSGQAGDYTISKIETKFDEDTGEKYKVFTVSDRKFDSRTGDQLKRGLFYISTLDD